MKTPFPAPMAPTLAIADCEEKFPIRRVWCVGRNYADHAREMGSNPDREPPIFFSKQPDCITNSPQIPYPPKTNDLHHEVELVVALGPKGRIFGYAVGIDLTRRDLQATLKTNGQPWDVAKSFDFSGPIGRLMPCSDNLPNSAITLTVNSQTRQTGTTGDMIWSVPEVIEELKLYTTLAAGDLIFTGTPAGVSAVTKGDKLTGTIAGLPELSIEII